MVNSRQKGKRGELQVASLFRDEGFPARRTQQYSGTEGTSDVTVEGLALHVEVKWRQALNIYKAMRQAQEDNAEAHWPVVFHRRNQTDWHVTMRADDWFEFLREAADMLKEDE